ncbi:hypothetical protein ACFQ9X_33090 [Catenulispora yoronensis]
MRFASEHAAIAEAASAAFQGLVDSSQTRDTAAMLRSILRMYEAVDASREAADTGTRDQADHVELLTEFAAGLERAHAETGLIDALQESVDLWWEAVNSVPDESLEQRRMLGDYAEVLTELFDLQPTSEVVMGLTRMMRMAPAEARSEDSVALLAQWADELRPQAVADRRVGIWQEIVAIMRIVVDATSDDDPAKTGLESTLASDLRSLASCGGTVQAGPSAASSRDFAQNSIVRSTRLVNLGVALSERYDLTGETAVLSEALTAVRSAIAISPEGDRDVHSHLSVLGTTLLKLWEATGDDTALAESISTHEAAIAAMAGFDQANAPRLYSNYAGALGRRATTTGDIEDYAKAAQVARTAAGIGSDDDPGRFIHLMTLGNALGSLAQAGHDDSLLPEAVAVMREALARTPAGHPGRSAIQMSLARLLQESGARSHDKESQRTAVQLARDAIAAIPGDFPNQHRYQGQLADAAMELFALTFDPELLNEAVAAGRASLATLAQDTEQGRDGQDARMAGLAQMTSLMIHLQMLFRWTRDSDLLHESVALGTRLLAVRPPLDPNVRALVEVQVALAKGTLGRTNGDPAALDEALETARAVMTAPVSDPSVRSLVVDRVLEIFQDVADATEDAGLLTEALDFIGAEQRSLAVDAAGQSKLTAKRALCLAELYKLTQSPDLLAGLRAACVAATESVAAHADETDDLAVDTLAELFRTVYRLTDSDDDLGLLDLAVQVGRAAVQSTAPHDVDRANRLADLVTALDGLARTRADPAIREEAVGIARAAADAVDPEGTQRTNPRLDLAKALRAYYEVSGDPALLAEAEAAVRESLATRPDDIASLLALSQTLTEKAHQRDPEAITEAIEAAQAALDAVSPDDPGRGSLYTGLGSALHTRFELTRDISAITEAIDAYRIAVNLAISRDTRAGFTYNLSQALRDFYSLRGDSDVLAESVALGREAAATTVFGHPEYAKRLTASAANISLLYDRTGQVGLLDDALDAIETAMAATSPSAPDYAGRLTIQGNTLWQLFIHTDDDQALLASITVLDDAVRRTPVGHPLRAGRLTNLATVLAAAVSLGIDVEDSDSLDEANATHARIIGLVTEAVATTPDDHPALADHLIKLGRATFHFLLAEYDDDPTWSGEGLDEVQNAFRLAAEHTAASPETRLSAYALMLSLGGMSPTAALASAEEAIALLPLLADRTLSRADREFKVSESKGSVATQFATLALNASQPERAVEILEQTRGILVADRLRVRSVDMARLEEVRPGLAHELRSATELLDDLQHTLTEKDDGGAVGEPVPVAEQRLAARRLAVLRQDALAAHTRILAEIRATEGFQDFLEPKFSDLAAHAAEGPVVYVYAGPQGGVALAVDAGHPGSARSARSARSRGQRVPAASAHSPADSTAGAHRGRSRREGGDAAGHRGDRSRSGC